MEQAATSPRPYSKVSLLLTVGPAVMSVVLSVGLAYGTTKFTQGETQKSIDVLEKQQSLTPSRIELQTYMDALNKIQENNAKATTQQLQDIKDNIIELRKEVRGSR